MKLTTKAPIEIECADGDVETDIQILKFGTFDHAAFGKFTLDAKLADEMVRNYDSERGMGHERFITIGHPQRLDGAPAAGWITRMERTDDGVRARVRLLKGTAERIKAGEFRYFSPTFTSSGKDEQGKSIGARLLSGAITNDPFLKGMKPFELSACDADEVLPMNEQTQDASAVQLAEAEQKVTTLSAQVTSLTEQVASKDARILELAAQVAEHESKALASEIRSVVEKGERDGKLSPALRDSLLPGVADDPVKALADSPFRDVKALAAYFDKAPVVVDLGDRKSTDAGNAPVSLAADDPNHPDILSLSQQTGIRPEFLARAAKRMAERDADHEAASNS